MSDPISRLNAALTGRYRIERQLGEGGMATVYLAEDLRHERKVALKVLRPELAAVVGAERFLAEIRTTANLQHPHILPLFDSGEADGFLVYAMPYVDGESLRERLDRAHQLSVDEAVRIATQVAEALDYAHRQGVVHRDVKPANVLIHDGEPVVSDFGIALAVDAADSERMTETGLSLGTPHYMSPEQATGDGPVGPATDVYALGCVLYEMLTGEPPLAGKTAQAVLGRIVASEPEPVSLLRKSVPPAVEAAVAKALEKLPVDRFSTCRQLAEALSEPSEAGARTRPAYRPGSAMRLDWGVVGALAFAAAIGVWAAFGPGGSVPVTMDVSIAVMPFEDLSPEGNQGHFVGGLQGAIVDALLEAGLDVRGRTSTRLLADRGTDVATIAGTLGVANVLGGDVLPEGDRVRVRAELIEVQSRQTLWSQSYTRELTGMFEVHDDIARSLADRLQGTLAGTPEGRLVADATGDVVAYEAYLRGRELLRIRTDSTMRAAIAEFTRALSRDGEYAQALAGLSEAYLLVDIYALNPDDVAYRDNQQRALTHARRAVSLDSNLYSARYSLAFGLFMAGEWEEADLQFREAIRLNSGDADTRMRYSQYLYSTGRPDEAVTHARRALELDPAWPLMSYNLGQAYRLAGDAEAMLAQDRETLRLDPDGATGLQMLALDFLITGDYGEGRSAWAGHAELLLLPPDTAQAWYESMIRYRETGQSQPLSGIENYPRLAGVIAPLAGAFDKYVEAIEYHVGHGLFGWIAQFHQMAASERSVYSDPSFREALSESDRYQGLLQEAGITS